MRTPGPSICNLSKRLERPTSRFPPESIRGTLILLLLVVLVPVLLTQVWIYNDWLETRRATELQANLELARAVADGFGAYMEGVLRQELAIGIALTASPPPPANTVNRLLAESVQQYPALRNLGWVDLRGRVIASSAPEMVSVEIGDRPYFQEIISGQGWAVSDLLLARVEGDPVFTISRGVRDQNGSLLGVVVATIDPKYFGKTFDVERAGQGSISIFDRQGRRVYRYPEAELSWEQRDPTYTLPVVSRALAGEEVNDILPWTPAGDRRIMAITPIPDIGWAASAGRAEAEAMAPVLQDILPQSVLSLLVTALAFTVAIVISRRIIGPVHRLREHAYAIGRGDFAGSVKVAGPAELEQLADAFNRMGEEIHRQQKVLRESEERYRTLVESVDDCIYVKDAQGHYLLVNSAMARRIGRPAQEIIGRTTLDIYPPEVARVTMEMDSFVFDKGETIRVEREEDTPYGHAVFDARKVPLTNDAGEVIGLVAVSRDITERKQMEDTLRSARDELEARVRERTAELARANQELKGEVAQRQETEQALRQASAYNRSLIEASLDPLVTINAEGKITDVNLAGEKVTGRSRGEIIGADFSDYFVEPEVARAGYQQVFRDGSVQDYALEIRHRDGHTTPVLYNASLYRDEAGEVIGVFAAARDISAQKRAEAEIRKLNDDLERRVVERTAELAAANKELEAFSYSVSHDLRAPLRGIDGFSQALLEDYSDRLDEQGKDHLRRVRTATLRMAKLIDDLLTLSRLTRSEMHRELVDLTVLAQAIATELQKPQPEREATFIIAQGVRVYADAQLMRAVLENLLGNAWKFTSQHPRATIEFGISKRDGERAYYVRDDGAGFDMAYADKLFVPFQRLHAANEFAGTGVGLATVQRVVRRHGGQVWAEGAVGKGATFFFTLGPA
ncbi:MAG: PAS domain S-box protein [Chloroflexi bacterium]|nr:PAS domain S-box protein [Chloroflexota bacterium]